MEVKISREEIKKTAGLLKQLERWELLAKITGQYNRGSVTLAIDGNGGKETISLSVDSYTGGRIPTLEDEISAIVGEHATVAAQEVCELIRKRLPLAIDS